MNCSPIAAMLLLLAALAGCASNPEDRPYSAEESYQLSLEQLGRLGLPYDEYARQRAVLVRAHDSSAHQMAQVLEIPGGRDS